MEASTTTPNLEPEPREWRARNLTVAARLWCGGVSFFFASFVFAYFYLHALNTNHDWKIGSVAPSGGLGVAIMSLFLLSGLMMWLSGHRPASDTIATGVFAIVCVLLAVALQFLEYSTLGFGPASGGYASVFFGWTITYSGGALLALYWMETQMATVWRGQRDGWANENEEYVAREGVRACSIFWTYYVALGVIAYIILYLV